MPTSKTPTAAEIQPAANTGDGSSQNDRVADATRAGNIPGATTVATDGDAVMKGQAAAKVDIDVDDLPAPDGTRKMPEVAMTEAERVAKKNENLQKYDTASFAVIDPRDSQRLNFAVKAWLADKHHYAMADGDNGEGWDQTVTSAYKHAMLSHGVQAKDDIDPYDIINSPDVMNELTPYYNDTDPTVKVLTAKQRERAAKAKADAQFQARFGGMSDLEAQRIQQDEADRQRLLDERNAAPEAPEETPTTKRVRG